MKRTRLGTCLSMLVLGLFYALPPAPASAQDAGATAWVRGAFTGVTVDDSGWQSGPSVNVSAGGTDPGNHFTFSGTASGQAGLGVLKVHSAYDYTVTYDPYSNGSQWVEGGAEVLAYFYDWMTVTGPVPGDPISVNLQFSVAGTAEIDGEMGMNGVLLFDITGGGVLGYDANNDPITSSCLWYLPYEGAFNEIVSIPVYEAAVGQNLQCDLEMMVSLDVNYWPNINGVGPWAGFGLLDFLNTVTLDKVVVTDPQDVVLAEFDGSGNLLPGYESSGYGLVQVTPEPGSLCLLALGALATLRRRRKM